MIENHTRIDIFSQNSDGIASYEPANPKGLRNPLSFSEAYVERTRLLRDIKDW